MLMHFRESDITLPSLVNCSALKFGRSNLQYLHAFMALYSIHTGWNASFVAGVIFLGFVSERPGVFADIVQVLPRIWLDRSNQSRFESADHLEPCVGLALVETTTIGCAMFELQYLGGEIPFFETKLSA